MRIRAYATLKELVGGGTLDRNLPDARTVGDVLAALEAAHPPLSLKIRTPDGRLSGLVTVLLNGRSIDYLQGEATPVTAHDSISLFPPVGGG